MCNCGSVVVSTVSPIPDFMRNSFLFLVSARISFMKSPKASPLAVSYFLPEIPFVRRKADLYADKSGYLFVQYSGEPEIEERFNPEAFSELLKIIPVIEYIYDEKGRRKHGVYNLPEIDPKKVISYLNRFGVVGISDLNFRNRVITERDLPSLTRNTGISLTEAKKLLKGGKLSPKFVERLNAIREGNEVPYRIVEKILKDLARSARLYINLMEDPAFENRDILTLSDKNRKRIVSAWRNSGGAFKDSEDPAHSKFNLHEEWTYTDSRKRSHLDYAESSLSEFSQVMNFHLSIVSKSVLSTQEVREFTERNTGLETSFSAYLVNSFKDKKVKRFCIECGAVFLPMRIKEENKYCGEVCSKRVRNRNFRAKKKISASKAGSKATPKARKEKK